jgi:endonuclease/exonuclease/phosphatase family metal-dependent hydrolase
MRFVLYNIRYGTGTGVKYHLPFPFVGMMRSSSQNFQKITEFLRWLEPDVVGLVEVDNGSYRSKRLDQAEQLAQSLGFTHVYETKYRQGSLARHVPVLGRQGNAFITNQKITAQGFHWFNEGVKRLVIELELEHCIFYLVHLSLKYRHRQYQLNQLYKLFASTKKPVVVAGDFNAFWGDRELELFMAASGLVSANAQGIPTWPCDNPNRQLDFILHSPELRVCNFEVPRVPYSDHLPLVCDFEIPGE